MDPDQIGVSLIYVRIEILYSHRKAKQLTATWPTRRAAIRESPTGLSKPFKVSIMIDTKSNDTCQDIAQTELHVREREVGWGCKAGTF